MSTVHYCDGSGYEPFQPETQEMLTHIKVASGTESTIRELPETMPEVTGFKGRLSFDTTKPDGTPRKLMDVNRLARMGWEYTITLEDGVRDTYDWVFETAG